MSVADDDPPVPKLPRGRGMKLGRGALMRIAMTATLLVLVIVVARPCSDSVSKFVTSFGGSGSGSGSDGMPRPGAVDDPSSQHYERITPDMTDEQIKAVIERAKLRNAGSSGSGSSSGSSGSGSSGSGSSGSGSSGSG